MADVFSKVQEMVWWAWSYPVPWVWIGLWIAELVCLIGPVGMVIGLKMKREDCNNAKRSKDEKRPADATGITVMIAKSATGETDAG